MYFFLSVEFLSMLMRFLLIFKSFLVFVKSIFRFVICMWYVWHRVARPSVYTVESSASLTTLKKKSSAINKRFICSFFFFSSWIRLIDTYPNTVFGSGHYSRKVKKKKKQRNTPNRQQKSNKNRRRVLFFFFCRSRRTNFVSSSFRRYFHAHWVISGTKKCACRPV